jgi:hypothetical protein
MNRVCSIFSQLLTLFPRLEFEEAVREHRAERHARGFSCWTQFIAMLFCQLGRAQSLREICGGLATCEGKLRHLGVKEPPKRSTLSYANEHRPWQLYQTVFEQLLAKCQTAVGPRKKFRFKNRLLSLDGTLIDLCLEVFDWAHYRRTKGGVKLHLVLDHDGYLPCFAVMEPAKKAEIKVARQMRFAAGTVLVMDRGFTDYKWYAQLTRDGVFFVTRARWNMFYDVVEERGLPQRGSIIRDQVVRVGHKEYRQEVLLRRIELWDEERQEVITFLTNHMGWAASTIAAIYRDRWQIECFFRALKQCLRIKTFVGTSSNAVQVQIWTALIAMLLLKYLQLRSRFAWSLSNLVALLRQQLFVYRDLWTWLDAPFQPPEILSQQIQLELGLEA